MRLLPKDSDWRDGHHPPSTQPHLCDITMCPKCGKLGCANWWIYLNNKGTVTKITPKTKLYKVIRIAHAHFLKPTFEQRRNYNHVLKDTKTQINTKKEGRWRFTLNRNKIPKHVLEMFD